MNSFAPIDRHLIDVAPPDNSGYPAHLAAEDTPDALRDACGAASREFPKSLWIEPRDWADKARENDSAKTWAENYLDRMTNQSPTSECTCHSLRANFEAARNRARGVIFPDGPKKNVRLEESGRFGSVWVSPMSVYPECCSSPGSGANVRAVLECAVRRGMLPETVQPAEYGFKHALHGTCGKGGLNQSTGRWLWVKSFPSGWQETAKLFRPLEVVFPSSHEEAVCLLLHGYAVSVGRSGHAVPWVRYMPGEGAARYLDSYDRFLYDSARTMKSAWRGSFSIISTTVPDSWESPAS